VNSKISVARKNFCFVLFCFVLFCFVLFCFVLFCFVLFCYVMLCYVMFFFFLLRKTFSMSGFRGQVFVIQFFNS